MPLSDETTKQSLILALRLLHDHDSELDRLHISLQALVNVLAQRSPEFQSLHMEELRRLEQGLRAFGPGGARSIADSIDEMLRLVQQS